MGWIGFVVTNKRLYKVSYEILYYGYSTWWLSIHHLDSGMYFYSALYKTLSK